MAWVLQLAQRRASSRLVLLGPMLLGLGALAGFLLGMPETTWSFADVREGLLRQSALGDHRWPGQEPDPVVRLYARALLQAFGLPALLVGVGGAAALLRHRPALGLSLAACPLLYLVLMAAKPLFFARFALPLVPFGC